MSNKVRSSHKVKIEVRARASCNLMLAGLSIFYSGVMQKNLALKSQSSFEKLPRLEPISVCYWMEYHPSHYENALNLAFFGIPVTETSKLKIH